MNKNILISGLALLMLAGCKSTPKEYSSIPPIEVKSLEEYQWENDKSFALNIAQMAKPAGLGIGMEDEENPAEASNNLRDGFDKTTDVVTGMLTSGLVGAASFLSLGSKSDELRSWRSGLVDFIPASNLDDLNSIESHTYIKDYVAGKLIKALKITHPNLINHGAFFTKKTAFQYSVSMYISDSSCETAINTGLSEKDYVSTWGQWDASESLFDGESMSNVRGFCPMGFDTKVSGKIKINGQDFYILVSELTRTSISHYYLTSSLKDYEGIVLLSQSFQIVLGNGKKGTWNNGIPYVVNKGKRYFFDANEVSSLSSL